MSSTTKRRQGSYLTVRFLSSPKSFTDESSKRIIIFKSNNPPSPSSALLSPPLLPLSSLLLTISLIDLICPHTALYRRALNALQPQLHTTMTPDSWIAFCMRHPYLLYPVILVQTELRTALFGVSFWEGNTTYRSDLCDQQYLPFGKFLNDLLAGKLDPCYEKRRMRNKSATILMKPTQSPYFSNRRGIHSFEDKPGEPSAASGAPLAASRSKTPKAGTALTSPPPLSEMTSERDPSSERKLFKFDSHRLLFKALFTHVAL